MGSGNCFWTKLCKFIRIAFHVHRRFRQHQAAVAKTKDQWNEFVNNFIGFTIDFVYSVQPNSANSFHFTSMKKHEQRTKSNINGTEAAIGRWTGYSRSIPLACCSPAFNSFTFMKMYHIVVYNRRLIQFNVFVVVFLPTVMAKLVVKQLTLTQRARMPNDKRICWTFCLYPSMSTYRKRFTARDYGLFELMSPSVETIFNLKSAAPFNDGESPISFPTKWQNLISLSHLK